MTETLASLTAERDALAARLAALCSCISSPAFDALPAAQKPFIQHQATHTAHLVDTMTARILAWV
jgi:hypothetical protein